MLYTRYENTRKPCSGVFSRKQLLQLQLDQTHSTDLCLVSSNNWHTGTQGGGDIPSVVV